MKSTLNMPKVRHLRTKKSENHNIPNTGRVERILKLMIFLKEFRTIKQISSFLQVHRKSVHRYLNLLSQLGFDLEVNQSKKFEYRIKNLVKYFEKGDRI